MDPLSKRVQRSFSRSFDTYHDAASQQAWIANKLVQELHDHGAPTHFQSAFELGAGTGHLTQQLCNQFEITQFTVNDLSPEAKATAQQAGADFLCGDARSISWPQNLDLIASASMIQWMSDPAAFLQQAASALATDGWLAISGFGPAQYRELHRVGSTAMAPGLMHPTQMAEAVKDRLDIIAIGQSINTLSFETPRDVLKHLRKTGVNGRAQSTWTKSRLAAFSDVYKSLFADENGVSLTYNPTWIIARKSR